MTEAAMKRSTPRNVDPPASRAFQALLVPVDLTPASDRVLARLARLPLAADARVTLLHVIPANLFPGEQQVAERHATRALAEEVRHLRKQLPRKLHIEPRVKVGAAAKEIAAQAAEVQAELIVMGRGGGRVLRETFLGSTAERVVRQTQLPVLVVRLAARSAYRRPALALDLDEAAREAIRLMLRVLPPPRPQVEVVHAFDSPYHGLTYPTLAEAETEARKHELRSRATHALALLLATTMAEQGVRPEEGPTWKSHVRYGSPRTVVEKALRAAEPDLLVLGTHAHAGAAFVFLGTVAGELLRATRCDVLVVPPASPRE